MELGKIVKAEQYAITEEPYYEPIGREVQDFEVAFRTKRPVALVGPTGCGKTTLATYMAYILGQNLVSMESAAPGNPGGSQTVRVSQLGKAERQHNGKITFPYFEVPCHEDLTETHLIGRYGLNNEWMPGPLYLGAKYGGMVVLDEIVEARKDAVVLIHHLTDDQRVLPVTKKGEVLIPPDNFMVVICYNPGYQVKTKDLKPSTKQRFPHIVMDYPPPDKEKKILLRKVQEKTGQPLDEKIADKLVRLANEIRAAKEQDSIRLQEGASTRLLIMAGESYQMYKAMGLKPDLKHIVSVNILNPITTEETDRKALEQLLEHL